MIFPCHYIVKKKNMNGFVYDHIITIDINLLLSVCARLLLSCIPFTVCIGTEKKKKKKRVRYMLLLVANSIQAEKRETFANSKRTTEEKKNKVDIFEFMQR